VSWDVFVFVPFCRLLGRSEALDGVVLDGLLNKSSPTAEFARVGVWYTCDSAGNDDVLSALKIFGDDRGERLDIVGRKLDDEEDGVCCFTARRGPCGGGVGVGIVNVDFARIRSVSERVDPVC